MQHQSRSSNAGRGADDDVLALVERYFRSIYVGDAVTLRSTFHPRCRLFADVDGQPYEKSVDEYIDGVAARQSPEQAGEPFLMAVVGVEILAGVSLVRTHQQMLGFNYFGYLTLRRQDGRWQIVSKTFTNIGAGNLVR